MNPTNAPSSIQVNVRSNVQGSFMPYRYAFISSGQNKYTFLIPEGYRVDSSHRTEVKLISPEMDCFITVAFHPGKCPGTTEALMTHVEETFPDVAIQSSQTVSLAGYTAPSVDFLWKADGLISRASRTAFFSTPEGPIKIALTSSTEKFRKGVNNYNLILQTFRTSNNGRFDFVIGSDKP